MNDLRSMTYPLGGTTTLAVIAMVGVLLALFSAGCSRDSSTVPMTPESEVALLNRVAERWHAIEKKDFAATYEYTTPKYRRVFSKALYTHKFSYAVDSELTGVELLYYDARAAVASVAVRVMSKPAKQTSAASNAMGALPLTLHEKWIFMDGQWWHSTKS